MSGQGLFEGKVRANGMGIMTVTRAASETTSWGGLGTQDTVFYR